MVKRGQYSSLHSARGRTLPQGGAWNSRPARIARLELYYGNGTVLSRGVDPTLALETADNILIHSPLGGNRDLITPGYVLAGAMITRWALAGPTRF